MDTPYWKGRRKDVIYHKWIFTDLIRFATLFPRPKGGMAFIACHVFFYFRRKLYCFIQRKNCLQRSTHRPPCPPKISPPDGSHDGVFDMTGWHDWLTWLADMTGGETVMSSGHGAAACVVCFLAPLIFATRDSWFSISGGGVFMSFIHYFLGSPIQFFLVFRSAPLYFRAGAHDVRRRFMLYEIVPFPFRTSTSLALEKVNCIPFRLSS